MRNQSCLLRTSGLALLLTLLVVGVASAHANLIKSDPAPGALLGTAPSEVRLWYDEEVDVHFSEVQVLDKNLQRLDKNDLQAMPGDPKQIFITLKPLSGGTYTVAWKALSATDGHVTRGNFAFSVGNVTGPVIAPVARVSGNVTETDPLSVVVRGLNLLALLALTGTELFPVLLLERSLRAVPVPGQAEADVWSTWRGLSLAAFVLALLTTLVSLLLEASVVGNVPFVNLASSDAVARTLLNTRFGVLWSARMTLLLALGATMLLPWKFARFVAVLLGLGTLLTLSEGGHSAAVGGQFSLAVVSDWLHLAGVAVWVGGLLNFFAVMVVLWGRVEVEKRARWIAWMVPQFSTIALPTAFLIALTGLYSSLLQIPTPNALVATEYGASLTIKVALFLVMVGFGAINLLFVSPRFRRAVTTPERSAKLFTRFRLTVGAEVLLGISAVFLAGLLTLESPARTSIEQPSAPNIASIPASPQSVVLVDNAAPDVQVNMTISPTMENPTAFDVYLTHPQSTTGTAAPTSNSAASASTPITNALRVIIQFTLLDQDEGITTRTAQSKGDGHYVVTGNQITLPGMWKLHVIVRRAGVDDVAVDFPIYRAGSRAQTAASDPKAFQTLQISEATMNQLQSLRSRQDLNDGSNGVMITDYDYHAPNLMRFDVRGQASSIAIGPNQYYQDKNGNWTERARVNPFIFPQFNASTQAQDLTLGRLDILNGEVAQIVRYLIPDADGGDGTQFAEWTSTKDHRLMQLAMVAPLHFMMQYYLDYNSPQIAIAAPPNVAQETPASITAPASAPASVTTRSKGPITGDLEADFGLGMLVIALVVGLVASGRKRVKRQRYVLLVLSVFAILASIGIVLDAFAGAAAAPANALRDTSQPAQGKLLKTIGDLVVSVNMQPKVYSPSEIEIHVTDANGKPVQDVQRVDLATAMVGMTHGAVGITATPEGPGLYRADAMLFSMWGPSLLALRIERSDGHVQSGVIQFNVPPDVQSGSVPGMYRRPPGAIQTVDVAVYPQAILPRQVDVIANHPIRLEIMFVDHPPCGPSVYLEQLNLETAVTAEGLAELSFVPRQNARLEFTCKPAGLELSQSH